MSEAYILYKRNPITNSPPIMLDIYDSHLDIRCAVGALNRYAPKDVEYIYSEHNSVNEDELSDNATPVKFNTNHVIKPINT